ncbi:hypothetical protein ACQPXB_15360 [Amycolatopsis sp. CA-161197]|uniref:hypothetical protein n=1 Tax=unclassified Amycolatopsis TaxID=2618356 RepID=UPI00345385A4
MSLVLRNEFGTVRVSVDTAGAGPRLLVENLETGAAIHLDVLEVESLTRLTHDDFAGLVRPH